jgi:predicted GNAT superfamily acetyltransferase
MPGRFARGTIVQMERMQLEVTPARADLRERAAETARDAATRAGVVVRTLDTLPELEAASSLIERIWDDGEPKAPTTLLRALSHAGGFVSGAYDDRELVGVSFGFVGLDASELHLHSHITGVDPRFRDRSVGYALKQFQRSWALARGITTAQWTADPLVRGNAYFNLVKLGASIVGYHDDFYGLLRDRLNAGGASDRALVRWDLVSDRSVRAASRAVAAPSLGDGVVILRPDGDGRPEVSKSRVDVTLHAWIPADIVVLRETDPENAREWRQAARNTIGRALANGYRADAITRDGWLMLTR